MELNELIREFGLNDKEVLVYISLLELGPSPARGVARKTGINRGTSYDILKKLVDEGLASFYRRGKQFFAAEPLEKLIELIEDKKLHLQRTKIKLEEKLPEFKTKFAQMSGRPTIRVYEESKGIRKILLDILSTVENSAKKEYYVYSSGSVKDRQLVYKDFPEFNKKRIEKGIKVQTIALGEGGETVGLDQRKQISGLERNTTETHEIIYSGKVAHIGLDHDGKPVGVIIENQGIFETQKMIFNSLWTKLKNKEE